jgi:molecular chaperone Hsp33
MGDFLVRAVSSCGHFRAVAAVTTGVVEELRLRHRASPLAAAALGRAMTGAFLLAADSKGEGRITVQILGDGPLGEIVAEADAQGDGRGYVRNPQVDLPHEGGKLPVGHAVGGKGTLTVIKELGLREPYRSVAPLTSGEIGKDFAYYLTVSEQVPSAVALGVYLKPDPAVGAAGGYLVQTLPGASDDQIDVVENNILEMAVPTELIRNGNSPEAMVAQVLSGFKMKWLGEQPLRFHCRCSKDRFSEALLALGSRELEQMIYQQEEISTTCEFCRESYVFSRESLEVLLKEAEQRDR